MAERVVADSTAHIDIADRSVISAMRNYSACPNVRPQTGRPILANLLIEQYMRRRFILGLVSLVSVMALVCACSSGERPTKHKISVNYSGLTHQIGAYGVGSDPQQLYRASSLGIGLIVGPPQTSQPEYQQALRATGMRVIDNTPMRMIYKAMCPTGVPRCARPREDKLAQLRRTLANYVRSTRALHTIAGYYILDDYVPNIDFILASVYQAMRNADPTTPLVCAFAVPVMQANADAASVASVVSVVRRNLQNYSPKWCDAVMLFSYAPPNTTPQRRGPYDWRMRKTLPAALRILRSKGWQQSSSALIGVPQAFEFWPRLPGHGTSKPLQYREGPNATELTTQVAAFCRAGATAIVAYTWRAAIQSTVFALYNRSAFRLGLLAGAQQCHRDYWR